MFTTDEINPMAKNVQGTATSHHLEVRLQMLLFDWLSYSYSVSHWYKS